MIHRHLSPACSPATTVATVLGLGVLLCGCTAHAERRAQAAQRWNQTRAQMKCQLARQQLERGQIEAATDTITEAVAIDRTSADPFLLLAQCRLEQGRLASARAAVAEARRCDPRSADADYVLGILYEQTDRLPEALEHYHRARRRDGATMDHLVAEAECLAALGRPVEAIVLVTEHLSRYDSDGTLEMLLGQLALLVDDPETAVRQFGLALERSGCTAPRLPEEQGCDVLVEAYGHLLVASGRHAEAVALLRPYVAERSAPSSSTACALGTAYLETDRTEDAKRLLREELRRRPTNMRGWRLLARAAAATGDWMTARRCVDRLERSGPDTADAHVLRGLVCWKQDDVIEAGEALRRALVIDPNDLHAHFLLGRLAESAERTAEAEHHYRRAVEIDPQFVGARRRLDALAANRGPLELSDARSRGGP